MEQVLELGLVDGEAQKFNQRRYTLTVRSTGQVIPVSRLLGLFSAGQEAYTSHFGFGEDVVEYCNTHLNKYGKPSIAGYPGPCYSSITYFDIDCANLNEALAFCQKLVRYIIDTLGFTPGQVQVWFSGCKGFHVGIPIAPFGLEPSPDFNKWVKALCLHIAREAGVTIDRALYDTVRLLRLPFSKHPKTGLQKIPINVESILSGAVTVETMIEHQNKTLTLLNAFEAPPCELNLRALAQTVLFPVHENPLTDEGTQNGGDAVVVGVEKVREGGRNRELLSLAGTMHKRKMTEKSVLVALLSENVDRCDPPLPDYEVRDIATNIQVYPQDPVSKPQRKKRSNADDIIDLVTDNVSELFYDERRETYALLKPCDGREIVKISSKGFQRWIARLIWTQLGEASNGEALSAARTVLDGKAYYEGKQYTLHPRVARHEGNIWIDLDGRRAICVSPNEWKIHDEPPILFRSHSAQLPLPDPVRGGDFWQALRFVKLNDRAQRLCFACHLVTAFVPDIPIVVVIAHGAHGAAKTTFLRVIRQILDPSKVEFIGGIKDLSEYAQVAFQNRMIFFDNLSYLPDWLSDAFCRTVSGDGWLKRTLYSDEDTTVFHYRRLIGFSGINLVANKADVLDRAMIYSLDRIDDSERMEEEVFWSEFRKVHPEILGGLLDVLAKAMAIMPTLQISRLPRMADYAKWAAAAAVALGYSPQQYLQAYAQNTNRQNEAAIEASPVAQAVLTMMKLRGEWSGTPASLLKELEDVAEQLNINTKVKPWPTSPSWLSRRLNEVQPNLLSLGITVHPCTKDDVRLIEIKSEHSKRVSMVGGMVSNDYDVPPCEVVAAHPNSRQIIQDCDTIDGNDSKSATFRGEPHIAPAQSSKVASKNDETDDEDMTLEEILDHDPYFK